MENKRDRQAALEKEAAYRSQCQTESARPDLGHSTIGSLAYSAKVAQPTLRESIGERLERATSEAHKRERLAELAYLLDENPRVARILELLRDIPEAR